MQVVDVARVVATRLLVPLFVCGNLLLLAHWSGPEGAAGLVPVAVATMALLSPVHPLVSMVQVHGCMSAYMMVACLHVLGHQQATIWRAGGCHAANVLLELG